MNSPLVVHTNLSPNKTTKRTHTIDTITIHCTARQVTAEELGEIFAKKERQASSNYGVDKDGRIGLYVNEESRSWCSSNAGNDHRAVTIEVSSDAKSPYAVSDAAYASLIYLVADICRRNGIRKLLWKHDKALVGKTDADGNLVQNMTLHKWFANKACPGAYLEERMFDIAAKVNALL
jgi:N-acetyl-anhydromuramyl-L-alanine amidase AmpD